MKAGTPATTFHKKSFFFANKKKCVFLQIQNMSSNRIYINPRSIFLNIKKRDVYDCFVTMD